MATRWWYTQDGTIVGFLADDGKWFYKQPSGEPIGYVEGNWIFTPDGTPIGYFGDGGWIFDPNGQQLGYLQP